MTATDDTGDLVQRLRQRQADSDISCDYLHAPHHRTLEGDAADEIERLRGLLVEWVIAEAFDDDLADAVDRADAAYDFEARP